jgi:orotate phosphoribosyltransferase
MTADIARTFARKLLADYLAAALWRTKSVRVNFAEPYKLVSGKLSPLYVNCRNLISDTTFPDALTLAAREIMAYGEVQFEMIAGGESAGIPVAAFLAKALGRPMVYVRKTAKDHGLGSRIEGQLLPDARVLLVEDLITDAGSKLSFIEALKAAGATVDDVLVVFDRLQGGRQALADHGIRLHALCDLADVLRVGIAIDRVTLHEAQMIREHLGLAAGEQRA